MPRAPRRNAQDATPALDLSDLRHVRALFLDLWGRTPDRDELELAQSASKDSLIGHLCGAPEFWEHWYEDELYYFLLIDNARPAEPGGADGVPARLGRRELDVLGAVQGVVSGSAFHRANPGNDTFVSVVLEQLLGVDVQRNTALLEAGKRMYDGQPASLFGATGSNQADIVAIACRQPGFAQRFVERQHARIVGQRPPTASVTWPTPAEFRSAAAALEEAPASYPELVRAWVFSPAYAARLSTLRGKTDLQFIRGLFVDLTGSVPSSVELQRLRGALSVLADAGPLRSVIARALLETHGAELPRRDEVQPEAFVRDTFVHYLGRQPAPQELQEILVIYQQEDTQPATVVTAIVTQREYQYY